MTPFSKVQQDNGIMANGSVAASSPALAEESEFHRSNVTVGAGAITPVANATNYFTTAPLFTIGYGYRFKRLFQADTGIQIAFVAENDQIEVSAGGGAIYLHHSETDFLNGSGYLPSCSIAHHSVAGVVRVGLTPVTFRMSTNLPELGPQRSSSPFRQAASVWAVCPRTRPPPIG